MSEFESLLEFELPSVPPLPPLPSLFGQSRPSWSASVSGWVVASGCVVASGSTTEGSVDGSGDAAETAATPPPTSKSAPSAATTAPRRSPRAGGREGAGSGAAGGVTTGWSSTRTCLLLLYGRTPSGIASCSRLRERPEKNVSRPFRAGRDRSDRREQAVHRGRGQDLLVRRDGEQRAAPAGEPAWPGRSHREHRRRERVRPGE